VRIQKERQQIVISDGPYGYIRHPGYVGIMFMVCSMALVLGSIWALLPAAVVTVLLIIRTTLEDRTLKKELKGYLEYSNKVRYRLLPGIW
jgi:protein-S-isoprenylcysteine O-methyltransferase Ste14